MPLYLTSTFYNCQKPLLDKINPKDYTLAIISNASDSYIIKPWVYFDVLALRFLGFKIINLDLRNAQALMDFYKNKQINGIYVAGGNSFYLLELMKTSGFFDFLSSNIENYLYIGTSAGSVVCCGDIDLIKYLDKPLETKKHNIIGLKIVEKLILPHFGSQIFKRGYEKMLKNEKFNSDQVLKLQDNQALWVENGNILLVQVA